MFDAAQRLNVPAGLASPQAKAPDGVNRLEGTIGHSVYAGDSVDYAIHVGQTIFRVRAPARQRLNPGEAVALHIGATDCLLLADS